MTFSLSKSVLMLSAVAVLALPGVAHAFTDAEKTELGDVIRAYILDNPELILEAVEKHRANETAKAEAEAETFIKSNYDELTGQNLPFIGNPDADVTVVEFMDYNCGYCKRALPDIMKLVEQDKNVKVVFHEMPVLGPSSQAAAAWALAAHKQGKYFEYHSELMKHKGSKGEKELIKLAKKLDLDVDQMKEDAVSDATKAQLAGSFAIARKLGVQGTPAFIVGETVFRGYIGHDGLINAIKAEREKG